MFLSFLIFQSISVVVGSISIKRARSIYIVRNLACLLVNIIRTATACETLIIKQPNPKIINIITHQKPKRSREWQEEKGTLPCLI